MEFAKISEDSLRAELHALLDAKVRSTGELTTKIRVLEVRMKYMQEDHESAIHELKMQHSANYAHTIAQLQESIKDKDSLIDLMSHQVASLTAERSKMLKSNRRWRVIFNALSRTRKR